MCSCRYQHKIGTYDKQLWETKIEQREQRIYGLNHIQMRSAKLNTELIDLDLVRGKTYWFFFYLSSQDIILLSFTWVYTTSF